MRWPLRNQSGSRGACFLSPPVALSWVYGSEPRVAIGKTLISTSLY